MARKNSPQPLTLADSSSRNHQALLESPQSPASLQSPRSPFTFSSKSPRDQEPSQPAESQHIRTELPQSQTAPALQQYTTASVEGKEKKNKTGFFSNYKASKSSSRLQHSDSKSTVTEATGMSRDPERPAVTGKVSTQEAARIDSSGDRTVTRRPVGGPPKSDSTDASNSHDKKGKPKPFSLLGRTKSIRGDEHSPREPSPNSNKHPEIAKSQVQDTIRPAQFQTETDNKSFRERMGSNQRQHSADRVSTKAQDMPSVREPKDNGRTQTSFSNSFREAGGHSFLNNLKAGASKGAGALSKGLFGKGERRDSATKKEMPVDDEHYVLKVINKPLVEQTRLTRISKRLEESKDKTEFWMPSFPWRAIDYLNYKGSHVEGLYRIPGSGPQIKKWQRRFDEELDIDLFAQSDLYDINIIGSMLKAWLRTLPDELLPKAAQDRVAKVCVANPDSDEVPQLLIDELAALSPFNYYLLFAITCHLSLLLAHSDKNKMDYRNLCICFQPCMKIDAFCFRYLVCNWRECWSECKNEDEYIEAEYRLFEQSNGNITPPKSAEGRSSTAVDSHEERTVSSSDSGKPPSTNTNDQVKVPQQSQQRHKLPLSHSQDSVKTVNTTLTVNEERTPPRRSADKSMRPLSPIKPLSPIGL